MKKSILTIALLVAGMATTFAAEAVLSYGASSVTIIEDAAFSDAFDNGVDAKDFNTTGIAVIDATNQRWASWATNDLSNAQFSFGFNAAPAADVVLNVSGVVGDIYINGVKLADGDAITLTPDDFNADGSIKAGKLVVSTAVVAKQFCFRENTLFIDGYKGDATVTIDGTAVVIDSDHFTRAFTQAEAGRHTLHIDGQDYLFDAFPAVTKKN